MLEGLKRVARRLTCARTTLSGRVPYKERQVTFKQRTLNDIIESERAMALSAPARFGGLFANALDAYAFLGSAIRSIDSDRFILAGFLSQIRKHHMLAILSVVRLHHVQAMINLRQVLEAGTCAAYAIVHTDQTSFADSNPDGTLEPTQTLIGVRYKWLEQNYRSGSDVIKRLKHSINSQSAHANIVNTSLTMKYGANDRLFETSFFDEEDDFVVRTDLWLTANVAIGLIDLFYEINRTCGAIKFVDDFVTRFKALVDVNERHKAEMTATETYQAMRAKYRNQQPDTK